jgi:hypothetical protein
MIGARHQALANTFTADKSAILSAINDQVNAGNLAAALAECNKYDNADADLVGLRLRVKASLAKRSLQDESRLRQIPANHEYPPSGDAEPKPLPKVFRSSVIERRVMNFTLLYPSCRGTRIRNGPPFPTGRSPPFIP